MVNNLAIISRLAVSVRRSDLVLPILGSDKCSFKKVSMGLTFHKIAGKHFGRWTEFNGNF